LPPTVLVSHEQMTIFLMTPDLMSW